ncbi:hypothetical protein ACMDCR_03945 [Labrys okinawensis]|uniref:hypothetical protein n=1 Tax=Labrys okinawensis TaxID=346911 RepID=UPI0039BCE9C1
MSTDMASSTSNNASGEKRKLATKKIATAVLCSGLCVAGPVWAADLAVSQSEPPPPPIVPQLGWQFQATAYGWASALKGDAGVGRLPTASLDASFGDILKNLKGAFMGAFIARNDTFIFGADLIWTRIGVDGRFKVGGNGPFAALRSGTSVSFQQDQTIATAFAGYRIPIGPPNLSLYGTVGVRYQNINVELDLSHTTVLGTGLRRSTSDSTGWADPLIGFAATYHFNDKWYLNALGDFGATSSSNITAQGLVSVGYNWTQSFSTALGFRALYTDYENGNDRGGSFRYKSTLYGPFVSMSYNF